MTAGTLAAGIARFRQRLHLATLILWGATAAFTVVAGALAYVRYRDFGARVDLAVFTQASWLIGHWERPYLTVIGRHLLGDHVSPGFLLFVPFGALGGPAGLLAAQTVAIAAAAPVLFALARALGATPGLALIAPLGYLATPAVHGAALFDFHLEAGAPVLLAAGALALVRRRPLAMIVALALACLLKEEISLTVAALGVVAFLLGQRRLGALVATGAVGWYAVATAVILPAYGDAVAESYLPRFGGDRGDTAGEIVRYVLNHPGEVAADVFSGRKLALVFILAAATAGLCFAAPRWLVVCVPALGLNLFSAYEFQHDLSFHYFLVPAAAFGLAAAAGAARAGRWARRVRLGLGTLAVLGLAVLAGVSAARDLRAAGILPGELQASAAERHAKRRALAHIPDGVGVAASEVLLPRLARRREVYYAPEPFVAIHIGDWESVRLSDRADSLEYVVLDGSIAATPRATVRSFETLLASRGFRVVWAQGEIRVYRRSPGA